MGAMHFVQDYSPMLLGGLSFLFVLLPVSLVVFYASPVQWRPAVLLGISWALYLLVDPAWFLLMPVVLALDYLAMALMVRWRDQAALQTACAAVSVGKNVCLALAWAVLFQANGTRIPLGLFIYTMSSVGAVLELRRKLRKGKASGPVNPVSFALHCCFFPQLYAGPLASFSRTEPQMDQLSPDGGQLAEGYALFVQGMFQNMVLGGGLTTLYETLKGYSGEDVTVLSAWCLLLAFGFSLYFLLYGYGNMARGLGLLFGLELPENFRHPYEAASVTDFFGRFNCTVHRFFQDTVYRAAAGAGGRWRDCLGLLLLGLLAGMWLGVRHSCLVWGLYLGLFLVMEKHLYPRVLEKLPNFLRRLYCLCAILIGFTLLAADGLEGSAYYLNVMFRFHSEMVALYNTKILYLLSSNWLLLALALFFVTSGLELARRLARGIAPRVSLALSGVANTALLVITVALTL